MVINVPFLEILFKVHFLESLYNFDHAVSVPQVSICGYVHEFYLLGLRSYLLFMRQCVKKMWLWSVSGRVYNPTGVADVNVPNWIHKA